MAARLRREHTSTSKTIMRTKLETWSQYLHLLLWLAIVASNLIPALTYGQTLEQDYASESGPRSPEAGLGARKRWEPLRDDLQRRRVICWHERPLSSNRGRPGERRELLWHDEGWRHVWQWNCIQIHQFRHIDHAGFLRRRHWQSSPIQAGAGKRRQLLWYNV